MLSHLRGIMTSQGSGVRNTSHVHLQLFLTPASTNEATSFSPVTFDWEIISAKNSSLSGPLTLSGPCLQMVGPANVRIFLKGKC